MNRNDLPIGFTFALAQNPDAMQSFVHMPEMQKAKLLQKARAVTSKTEMQALVNGLNAQNG